MIGFIAGRYLFAKKSHNVINIISIISAVSMAIGTAALVVILSVYNGFSGVVSDLLSNVESDLVIKPVRGKAFVPQGPVYDWMYAHNDIKSYSYTIEENVFLSYDNYQTIAKAKGVDEVFEVETSINEHIVRGKLLFYTNPERTGMPYASVGSGLAGKLGINPSLYIPLYLYYPSKNASPSGGLSSLNRRKLLASSIFSINADIDNSTLLVPLNVLQELMEYSPNEVGAVEIRLKDPLKTAELKAQIAERVGPDFKVLDRYEQNPSIYKMMKYEKAAIYMILLFIIIIISFNIFGALSMLLIDKQTDCTTFQALGMPLRRVRMIFVLEGWLISFVGVIVGVVLGCILVWIQSRFGLIMMPGNFTTTAYPVDLQFSDIALSVGIIALIGFVVAYIPAYFRVKSK